MKSLRQFHAQKMRQKPPRLAFYPVPAFIQTASWRLTDTTKEAKKQFFYSIVLVHNLQISASALTSWNLHCKTFLFVSQNHFLKNKILQDIFQYSFLCLVIRHQCHFDTKTHFSTISLSSIQRRPLVIWKKVFQSIRSKVVVCRPAVY